MRIGELASRTGLSRDTLRFYERKGLIHSTRSANGYRVYNEAILPLLYYIKKGQSLGFTLSEIGNELPALFSDGLSEEQVASILRDKISQVEKRIQALHALHDELKFLMQSICPISLNQTKK